jgi:6,7-dimethyl-8-ribityllumazine synthase
VNDRAPRIVIVEARFYQDIADELVRGATAVLDQAGARYDRFPVPGAFEIPAMIHYAVHAMNRNPEQYHYDGFVALGCVIRGETSHYDYVCGESARGLQELSLRHDLALGYGVLTVDTRDQAWARAAVDGRNKGGDAARACLRMIELKRHFKLDR